MRQYTDIIRSLECTRQTGYTNQVHGGFLYQKLEWKMIEEVTKDKGFHMHTYKYMMAFKEMIICHLYFFGQVLYVISEALML